MGNKYKAIYYCLDKTQIKIVAERHKKAEEISRLLTPCYVFVKRGPFLGRSQNETFTKDAAATNCDIPKILNVTMENI